MHLTFTLLDSDLAIAVEPWFDDPDTMRHLGGREWVHQVLHLTKVMPGFIDGDITVLDRRAWVVEEGDRLVALLDVEVYDDRTASLAIVVSPEARRRGVAKRVLATMWNLGELAGVESVFGCIDADNEPSRRCFKAAGFTIAEKPDHEGVLLRRGYAALGPESLDFTRYMAALSAIISGRSCATGSGPISRMRTSIHFRSPGRSSPS